MKKFPMVAYFAPFTNSRGGRVMGSVEYCVYDTPETLEPCCDNIEVSPSDSHMYVPGVLTYADFANDL